MQTHRPARNRGILNSALFKEVAAACRIDTRGAHGIPHWARVRANGLRLAASTGANPTVIELFALFHDSQRHNEYEDPDHGKRGADNAAKYWRAGAFELDTDAFEQLYKACSGHTYEDVADPCITVLTCWDADRLDLGRVGIVPDPARLCTDAARQPEIREWAWQRSMQWVRRHYGE